MRFSNVGYYTKSDTERITHALH